MLRGIGNRLPVALIARPEEHHPRRRGECVGLVVEQGPTGELLEGHRRGQLASDVGLIGTRAPQSGHEVGELRPQLDEAGDAWVGAV